MTSPCPSLVVGLFSYYILFFFGTLVIFRYYRSIYSFTAHYAAKMFHFLFLENAVPVFLYAAAHPTGKPVEIIRRELGYYRPNFMGSQWAGWSMPEMLPHNPEEGPIMVSKAKGISMIGARPWVALYNVPILSTDVSVTRRIARRLRGRGGGLPTVMAMALGHGDDSTEIACMLLEPNQIGADRVQNRVEMLAAEEGLEVERGYFTDFSPEMVIEKYTSLISNSRSCSRDDLMYAN